MYRNYSDSQLQSQHINPEMKTIVGQMSTSQPPQAEPNNIVCLEPRTELCCRWKKLTVTTNVAKNWDLLDMWIQRLFFYLSNIVPLQPFGLIFFIGTFPKSKLSSISLVHRVSICKNPDTKLTAQTTLNWQWRSFCL